MKHLRLFILCLFVLILFPPKLSADLSELNNLFPLPESLKPNVKFWIKVYTQYDQNQIIIHDSQNLNIIYEVLNVNELFSNKNISEKKKWKKIEKIKNEYQKILKHLAHKKVINPETLTEKERRVYKLFKPQADPAVFAAAVHRIRAQQGLRNNFKKGLIRSGKHMPAFVKIFKNYNLPLELAALPHVESSFNNKAYSKFGAAGLWQFTRGTGRKFLKINYTIDERFDPEKSTEAAAKLLKKNYEILGSWPLAITAYNHGHNGMRRAINKLGTTDIGKIIQNYRSRQFGFASKNFYAEFLAALHVSKNYKIYFGELEFEMPAKFKELELPYYMKISSLMKRLNLSIEEIKELNPSLRASVLKSKRRLPKGFKLRIPWNEHFDPKEFFAQFFDSEKFDRQIKTKWYQVEKGDNLKKIAKRFNCKVKTLVTLNDDIQNIHKIYAGQILRVPAKEPELALVQKRSIQDSIILTVGKIKPNNKMVRIQPPSSESYQHTDLKTGDVKVYHVQRGDNLERISNTFGTSVEKLMALNNIKNKNQIFIGQTIKLPPEKVDLTLAQSSFEKAKSEQTLIVPPTQDKNRPSIEPPISTELKYTALRDTVSNKGYIYVMPEETLGHFADWLEIPTQKLRVLNGLVYGQEIHLGQKIKIIFSNVRKEDFEQRRMEYHRSIEEDFFSSFRVDGVQIHKLKRGENVWYLCNEVYEVPYWLIIKYNPNINFEHLQKGDEIIIPLIASINES